VGSLVGGALCGTIGAIVGSPFYLVWVIFVVFVFTKSCSLYNYHFYRLKLIYSQRQMKKQ
jgi:hypothetical protein